MYRLSRFFVDRPVFATVISLLIVVVGAISFRSLPIAQYPEIVPPTIQVSAAYPGADAKTVADTIATPIEKEINGVEGMLYMSSQSTDAGAATITITFELGTDLDIAQVQVQNRVARAEPKLPEITRTTGVTVTKRSPDLSMVISVFSPDQSRTPLYVSNYASLNLKDELARVTGVGDIAVFGARDYSMRIWLDPEKLSARGLTTAEIAAALQEQNVQVAAGSIGAPPSTNHPPEQIALVTQGRLADPEEFGNIVVARGEDGQITYLRDVAEVELGAADYNQDSRLNGDPSVGIAIFQQPGSNQIETAEAIHERMEELKRSFPTGVDYRIAYDTTPFIEESVSAVEHTLVEAIILVFLVVLLFLQSWRATLIPLLAIPVSLIGALAVMSAFGFSLNNLSLFGLVLAIGIVVDDAIVVVENVERYLAEGKSPREATYAAMKEVAGALFSIGLVLSSVFIPTAFVPGISGQFYQQFALTIASATIISALVSLTLSPALCAILLPPHGAKRDPLTWLLDVTLGWFFKSFNWLFDKATAIYGRVVSGLIRLAVLVLLLYGGLLWLTKWSFETVPGGFIPQQDKGYVICSINLPSGASLERTSAAMDEMQAIVETVDGISDAVSIPGFDFLAGGSNPSAGAMFVILDSFEERDGDPAQSGNAIVETLNQQFASLSEGFARALTPPPVNGLGSTGGFKFILEAPGEQDSAAVARMINQAAAAAMETDEVAMAFSTYTADTPKIYLHIDREKAKVMDVPLSGIFSTLQTQLGSLYVNDFTYENTPYRVILMAEDSSRETIADVLGLEVRSQSGAMVPLSTLVRPEEMVAANRVFRYNLYPAADLQGTFAPGVSSAQGQAAVEAAVADAGLPGSVKWEWTELDLQQQIANEGGLQIGPVQVNNTILVFAMAVLFVFLVLAALYESWALPLAIILIVPMCLLSALLGLHFLEMDNNIFTQIGFVVLVGLACKNAILIVEVARQHLDDGMPAREAATLASRQRLRPILMTSMAFGLGVVPLALATGAGAEMRVALGVAVFFGMLGVTLFGIFLTPVFFVVIEWLRARLTRRPTDHPPHHDGDSAAEAG